MSHDARARPEQVWKLLRQFADAHSRHGDLTEALGFSLGGGQGKVLFALRDGELTLSQIAEAFGFDAPYATLVVDRLAERELVERRPHPDDRRRKLVALTDAGRAAVETAETILYQPPPAFAVLTRHELGQLTGLMERLLAADQAGAEPAE